MDGQFEWVNEEMADFHGRWKWLFKVLSFVGRPFTYKKYYLFIQRLNEPFLGVEKSKVFAATQMQKQYQQNHGE